MTQPATPAMPPTNADPIVVRLRQQIADSSGGGALLVVGGIFVCILSAVIVGTLISVLMNLWFGTSMIGFAGWTLLALIGLAVFVVVSLKSPPAVPDGTMNYTHGVPAGGIIDDKIYNYPLVGPRMVLAGVRLARPTSDAATEHFYDRCALLLRQIAKRGEAMPVPQLLIGDDETISMLDSVIRYLDGKDWIGISSDRDRVWLSTKGQAELRSLGVIAAGSSRLSG